MVHSGRKFFGRLEQTNQHVGLRKSLIQPIADAKCGSTK